MATLNKIPWEIGTIFLCSKCGAKFNEPNLAEELKTEIRKTQKENDTQGKIRVITSGCLGVCYPEKQTVAFMPVDGKTEVYTTNLDRDSIRRDVIQLMEDKLKK